VTPKTSRYSHFGSKRCRYGPAVCNFAELLLNNDFQNSFAVKTQK